MIGGLFVERMKTAPPVARPHMDNVVGFQRDYGKIANITKARATLRNILIDLNEDTPLSDRCVDVFLYMKFLYHNQEFGHLISKYELRKLGKRMERQWPFIVNPLKDSYLTRSMLMTDEEPKEYPPGTTGRAAAALSLAGVTHDLKKGGTE